MFVGNSKPGLRPVEKAYPGKVAPGGDWKDPGPIPETLKVPDPSLPPTNGGVVALSSD